jgi:hypothetical protein
VTLLEPQAALVAGALAVPALVLFYFLKLRRAPVRVSSTLLWERAATDLQVNVPLRWIRFSWLLLLQLLVLGLLVVAVGRPAFSAGEGAGARVILLIDRSASMAAMDVRAPDGTPQSRLQEAVRRARVFVEGLPRGAQIGGGSAQGARQAMIIVFAARPEVLAGYTADARVLLDALDAVTPTDQPGDLAAALKLAEAFIADRADETATPAPPTVLLLTDAGPENRVAGEPIVATGLDVQLVRVGTAPATAPASDPNPAEQPQAGDNAPATKAALPAPAAAPRTGFPNLGIVALSGRRDFDDPASVRVFARLQNAATEPVEARVRASLDGVALGAVTVRLPAAAWAGERLDPGEAGATITAPVPTGGVVVVTVSGFVADGTAQTDVLSSDDAASMVLLPPKRPRVVLVAPPQAGGGAGGGAAGSSVPSPDPFVRSVLDELGLGSLTVVTPDRAAELTGRMGETDLFVFDRWAPAVRPAVPTLTFGAGLPAALGGGGAQGGGAAAVAREVTGTEAQAVRPLAWERDHPALRYVALDNLVVSPPARLLLPPATPRGETPGAAGGAAAGLVAKPLIDGPNGPLAAVVEESGRRHLVVAFEPQLSNWGTDVSFLVFMSNAVDLLTLRSEESAGRWVRTDAPVSVTAQPGARVVEAKGPVTVRADVPAGVDATAGGTGPAGAPRVALGLVERAGLYRLTGVPPGQEVLAVNLCDPAESTIAVGRTVPVIARGGSEVRAGEGGPREVWHWFVLAALVLLTVEWFVYGWQMRA